MSVVLHGRHSAPNGTFPSIGRDDVRNWKRFSKLKDRNAKYLTQFSDRERFCFVRASRQFRRAPVFAPAIDIVERGIIRMFNAIVEGRDIQSMFVLSRSVNAPGATTIQISANPAHFNKRLATEVGGVRINLERGKV